MTEHTDTAIELKLVELSLTSNAGEVNILRGIDLSIKAGETIGVIGPSGSGKTSMLMVIAGLEKVTRGEITIAGHDLNAMNEDQLALFRQNHVGIVFQDFHLVPTMTALENAAMPLEFAGRSDSFERARAELDAVGLSHRIDHYPGQLSGGEQQRVALARAFAPEPTILLADEPTGNLDGDTGHKVMDLLFNLKERCNTTMMLVTHQPELAERCGRTIAMLDGKISYEG
ncbi:MAG: ABC transporter ATP-binding protein [Rhodospirillaceae bacterium]|nr:ABC transporter ATP-binding protein [Rhodospirillaceae bacterium]MBL6942406.1 ABC transporter ATP-binding protein [Rhodospirillales bacterium]